MFTLDEIVPWGRSFEEYCRMFALTDADLRSRILGCGDGPASFNAEGTRRGVSIVSVDPIYRLDAAAIRDRVEATSAQILEETRRNAADFVWDTIGSVDELGRIRLTSMQAFLADYAPGTAEGRYVEAALPALPFDDLTFDLALCSHFLFLYSQQLDEGFHDAAVREMSRVAHEVRVFPLLEMGGARSSHVTPTCDRLIGDGYRVSIETVPYEFRRGGNQMMRVRAS